MSELHLEIGTIEDRVVFKILIDDKKPLTIGFPPEMVNGIFQTLKEAKQNTQDYHHE